MVLKLGSTEIPVNGTITYNGSTVEHVVYNGVTVWDKLAANTVIFESSTYTSAGYTVQLPVAGTYRFILVGGGGGVASSVHKSTSLPNYLAISVPGGSGGYIQADLTFPSASTLTVHVGEGGSGKYANKIGVGSTNWTVSGTNAGQSSVLLSGGSNKYLYANGGNGGYCKIVTAASISGGILANCTVTPGTGGTSGYKNADGITSSNRTMTTGNTGTENHAGIASTTSSTTKYTATSSPVYSPYSNSNTVGRGGASTCYVKGTSWAVTATGDTYQSYDGYVKITYIS